MKAAYEPSFFGYTGTICKSNTITTLDTHASDLYELVIHNPLTTEICILNEDEEVKGILTRDKLLQNFSGRYGYNLNSKKSAMNLMNSNCLVVEADTPIEVTSKLALQRPIENIYDAVVVTQNKKYLGVVTVKDLLETAITIQVTRAKDENPLSGLPGNRIIEKYISDCIIGEAPFTVIYLDLDNFKAYNDAYGFNNGDLMIQSVVDCMELCCQNSEFKGHIGGDDFVIVANYWDVDDLCQKILRTFKNSIRSLYCEKDWENGSIVSTNRNGFKDIFPIVSLSIAGITNKNMRFDTLDSFSVEIAALKKECKKSGGNCYRIR